MRWTVSRGQACALRRSRCARKVLGSLTVASLQQAGDAGRTDRAGSRKRTELTQTTLELGGASPRTKHNGTMRCNLFSQFAHAHALRGTCPEGSSMLSSTRSARRDTDQMVCKWCAATPSACRQLHPAARQTWGVTCSKRVHSCRGHRCQHQCGTCAARPVGRVCKMRVEVRNAMYAGLAPGARTLDAACECSGACRSKVARPLTSQRCRLTNGTQRAAIGQCAVASLLSRQAC